jgi:predicted nucleic acid-binding protein
VSGYCLDSWAVLRWLEGAEPAASRVEAVLPTRPVMSWLNVGEVFYVTARATDERAARDVVGDLRAILALDQPSPDRVLEAASIKAVYSMAFGDAFAIATAIAHDAVLLTGDPEILDAPGEWSVEDLR